MDNLVEDNEPEISKNDPIEKPKRVMSEKTKTALALGRQQRAEKLALEKSKQKSIPEPILKKKPKKEVELPPIETEVVVKKKKKKQVIVYEDDSSDDEIPQIVIKHKTKKAVKADIPPPIPQPQEPEPVVEEKPKYRMRRI